MATLENKAKPILAKYAQEILGPPGHFWRFPEGSSPNDIEATLAPEFRSANLRFLRKVVWWAEDFSTDEGPCYSWLVSASGDTDEVSYFPKSGAFKWAPWEPPKPISEHVSKQAASVMKSITEAESKPEPKKVWAPDGGGIQLRNDVYLPNDTELKAKYRPKGNPSAHTVNAVIENGMIKTKDIDGNVDWDKSLSAAAVKATGARAINGWAFWKIKRPTDVRWIDASQLQAEGKRRIDRPLHLNAPPARRARAQ